MDGIPPSLDGLAAALYSAFPAVGWPAPLRLLGTGFSSLVVETPGGIVFRIARTAEAGAQYAREARLLLALGDLPVAVPRPVGLVEASEAFPYGVMGYHKLPGQPPEPQLLSPSERASLAVQVAEIMRALQRVSLAGLPLPAGQADPRPGWELLRADVLPALKAELSPAEFRRVDSWWESLLADERLREFSPVFQHGDLWYGNLLVEGERVVGLVDFEEAGPGDPAQDFVPQLYLGERFLRQVMAAFEAAGGAFASGFEHRLAALWGLREFGGLAYSIRHNDREELTDSIEKIRKGPILSRFGLDGWGSE